MVEARGRLLRWTRVVRESEEALENAKVEMARAEGMVFALQPLTQQQPPPPPPKEEDKDG